MEKSNNSKTILVIVIGFQLLSLIFKDNTTVSQVLFAISLGVGLTELVSPTLGNYIVWAWFKIAHILGWINTRILLTLVFYLVLLPFSLIYKIINRNSLQKNEPKGSVYKERNFTYNKESMENIW